MFILNGTRLQLDQPFSDPDGVQYPPNWLRLSTPEERAFIGIIEIDEGTRPDDRYHIVSQNLDYTYSVEEKPIATLRDIFRREIAAARYSAETAGTTIMGIPVETDRESQATFTGAAVRALRNPSYVVKWKSRTGFVNLTNDQILDVADAVGDHVQACFDREAVLLQQVEAAETLADLQAIPINTGWPE